MSEGNGQELPTGWAMAPIEDLFWPLEDGRTLHQGWSPLCEKTPAPTDEDWGVLKTTAIQAGAFLPQHNKQLPKHLVPRPQTEVKTGDILITCAGPRVRCGVACMVRHTRPRLMMSGKMYRFRVSPHDMDARYLEAFLLTPSATSAIDKMKTGGSDSGLNLTHDRFRPLPVPVAPLNEQRLIMDTVEELTSDLDAGVAALVQVQAKLKHYRAAVLKSAVDGDLTVKWRTQHSNTKPSVAPPTSILAERRHHWEEAQIKKFKDAGKELPGNWKNKYTEPIAPDTRELISLPSGWIWVSLDQLLWQLRSGTSETSSRNSTKYAVLKSSAVRHGMIDFNELNYLQPTQSSRSDNYLKQGDFLITRLSGSIDYVGCSAVVSSIVGIGIQYPDRIFCGKTIDAVRGAYLTYCFQHPVVRKVLESAAKSTAGHQRISTSDLVSLAIPLPPLDEQEAIIEAVETQLSVIDHLESGLEANLKSAQALRQSILRHAFTGKLVPQDPHDEPASELLKRIAAQREELARQAQAAKKTKPKAPPKRAAKLTRKKPSHD